MNDADDAIFQLAKEGRISLPPVLVDVRGVIYAALKDGTLGGVYPDFEFGPLSGEKVPPDASPGPLIRF